MRRHSLLALTLTPLAGFNALLAQDAFTLKQVTPSVYLAIANPSGWGANSNAAVVILDDGVLVVDSHSRPSTARALVKQIRRITDKPVRYVVDSHFHYDHAQGNQAYAGVWPAGAEIISSEATRFNLEHIGVARMQWDLAALPDSVVLWRGQRDAASDSAARAGLARKIDDATRYVAELKAMELTLPSLTFERGVTLRRGAQTVHVLYLGRGHTDGDVVVYLPRERVVATGDLLHAYAPFMWDSYPYDWIKTLGELEKLDFDYILPGHGGVLSGKDQIRLWREYLGDLMREVELQVGKGRSRSETVAALMPVLRERYASRFPPGSLEEYLASDIEKAWNVVGLGAR